MRMRIIINGVGIAGPTLAYWLRKAGHEVLLVEAAPQLRTGGYVIDFGLVGYDVAEKMGLIPRLRELGYQVKEMRFVDRHGRTARRLLDGRLRPPDSTAATRACGVPTLRPRSTVRWTETVETIFGDSVAGIEEAGACVRVELRSCPPA